MYIDFVIREVLCDPEWVEYSYVVIWFINIGTLQVLLINAVWE